MSGTEQVVSDLLRSLHEVERAFAAKRHELTREEGWRDVSHALDVSEVSIGNERHFALSGYVDGEREGVGGVGWVFDVIRCGDEWVVERSVVLNADDKDQQEVSARLPSITYTATAGLAAALPSVLAELLRLPAPHL